MYPSLLSGEFMVCNYQAAAVSVDFVLLVKYIILIPWPMLGDLKFLVIYVYLVLSSIRRRLKWFLCHQEEEVCY